MSSNYDIDNNLQKINYSLVSSVGLGILNWHVFGYVSFLIFISILLLFLFRLIYPVAYQHRISIEIIAISVLLKFILIIVIFSFLSLNDVPFGSLNQSDSITYYEIGSHYADYWRKGIYAGEIKLHGDIFNRHLYYYYNASLLYLMPGLSLREITLINGAIGTLIPISILLLSSQLNIKGKYAALPVAFSALDPKLLILSATNLKEIIIISLAISIIVMVKSKYFWKIFLIPLLLGIVFLLREFVALVLIMSISLLAVWEFISLRKNKMLYVYLSIPLVISLLYFGEKILLLVHSKLVSIDMMFDRVAEGLSGLSSKVMVLKVADNYLYIFIFLIVGIIGTVPVWRTDTSWFSILMRPSVIWFQLLFIFGFLGSILLILKKDIYPQNMILIIVSIVNLVASVLITKGTPEFLRYSTLSHIGFYLPASYFLLKVRPKIIISIFLVYLFLMILIHMSYFYLKN